MAKGSFYGPEWRKYVDEETGKTVWQMTTSPAHDHHLYFTNTSFHPNGKTLIFASARFGKFDMLSMDLETGEIKQLTDCLDLSSLYGCIDPRGREIYYFDRNVLKSTDIESLEERILYRVSKERSVCFLSVSSDGERLAFATFPSLPAFPDINFQLVYRRARKWKSDVVVVKTDGSESWIAVTENCWLNHANICPKDKDLIMYCHEGPWREVEQRMWLVGAYGEDKRPLRPEKPGDALGHEYWLKDGVKVGYHGWIEMGQKPIFGLIDKDGTASHEYSLPRGSGHCQSSSDGSIHVEDGGRFISLIKPKDDKADFLPLAKHNSTKRLQIAHPHPIFSPDDTRVLYTSDAAGVCNVYLVEL